MKPFSGMLLLLLAAFPCAAQFNPGLTRYHSCMNKAVVAQAGGKTDTALHYYRQALAADSCYKPPYYNIGKLLMRQGKYAQGIFWLEKHVRRNGDAIQLQYLFENYDSIRNRPEVISFQQRFPALVQERRFMAGMEELERLVYRMLGMEQAMRRTSESGHDAVSIHDIRILQCYVDTALTRPLLLEYIRAHGYPDTDSMDADLGSAFNVIVLHQLDYTDAAGLELDSIVRRALYAGRFSPHQYLMTLDRHHIGKTRKQLYGTYMNQREDGTWYFDPEIDALESVDTRRAAWGQLPLKDLGHKDWRNPALPAGYRP